MLPPPDNIIKFPSKKKKTPPAVMPAGSQVTNEFLAKELQYRTSRLAETILELNTRVEMLEKSLNLALSALAASKTSKSS